ncbi:hypothetical protein E5288_WYG008413 [Bos mutus]|uniref:Uncharacterized protein n=1 Tax=Bos mutus TaxID=72004 RepID=A0A6B0S8R5_9CETA|nr:hypothetical protein [Bos mutus]
MGAAATGRGGKQAKQGPHMGTVQATERPRNGQATRKTSSGPPGMPAGQSGVPQPHQVQRRSRVHSSHLSVLGRSLFRLVQLEGSSPGDTLSSEVAQPMPTKHHRLGLGRGQA